MTDQALRRTNGSELPVSWTGFGDTADVLRRALNVLRRRRALISIVTIIGTIATLLIVSRLTPQYQASSEVIIEVEQSNIVDFTALVGGVGGDNAAIASQVKILGSRTLAERIVDELDLMDDPEFNPSLRASPSSPFTLRNMVSLLPDSVTDALGLVDEGEISQSDEKRLTLERFVVTNNFLNRLKVVPAPSTYVIEISFTSANAEKAAQIADTTAELYILDQLEAKFEATRKANDWLSSRLDDLRQQVVDAEAAVAAYRIANNLGSESGNQSLIEQQLTQANAQLTVARSDLAAAQARYNQVQSQLQSSGYESVAEVLSSSLIQSLRQREAEAKRSLAELSTRYGERHPEIINAKADIEDLQQTIRLEVEKIIQNLANEVGVARARATSIEAAVDQLNANFSNERQSTVRLREIEREAEATRSLYDSMLSRFKEISEQEEIQQPNARIISYASVPQEPSFPRTGLILIAAAIGFCTLGIALAFVLEQLNSAFRTLDQIMPITGVPGLAEVPLLRRQARKAPLDEVVNNPTNAFSEGVRSVQTAVMLSNIDNPPKVIVIVSSVPEEGKSALSAALSGTIAMSGHKVVLVDCDLRRPQQHRLAGAVRSPGLSELLAGSHELADVLVTEKKTGLNIIPAGMLVPNPNDLLQSERMRKLISSLRQEFDYVIIDTPALLAVSDGLVMGRLADAAVMVVRWEKTPREVVQTVINNLRSVNTHVAGVVLTQVDQRKQARYGYGSYGYYYGRYKNYYAK